MADIILPSSQRHRHRLAKIIAAALVVLVLAVLIGWWWQSEPDTASDRAESVAAEKALAAAGMDASERTAIEAVVREYILNHPEILPEAIQRLQERGSAGQLAEVRDQVERPFPGAVLGNPDGKVTLVEFVDFACGYCRQSVADIEALTRANPDLKVVIREFPILSPASADAAKMALAAARQGRYRQFHQAMFSGERPSEQSIAAAASKAGLNVPEARRVAVSPEIEAELRRNRELAARLQINGTPAWVIGDRLIEGAVGQAELEKAISEARAKA